ncbi:hypothetical protein HYW40_01595 [Candidatus Curtissbacteria bacterium]|nr:hypothetical protein [Candidatus Curtissbacteria bacterium]
MDNLFRFFNFQGNYTANILFAIGFIWTMAVKGFALWRASQYKQLYWFVAILILNTLGVLEIIYLLAFAKKRLTFSQITNLVKRR